MRRGRVLLVLGAGLLFGIVGGLPATARSVRVDRQGYAVTGLPFAGLYASEGRLYVEIVGGREQARAFVLIAVTSNVRALILSLTEASASGDLSLRPESASVVACPVKGPFAPGPQPAGEIPEEDCGAAVPGSRDDRGRWTFDLSSFAVGWATGAPNHGVVIKPWPDPGAAWRLVFDTARTAAFIEEDVSFVPVPAAPATAGAPPWAPAAPLASVPLPAVIDALPAPSSAPGSHVATELARGSGASVHSERGRWPLATLVGAPFAAAVLAWAASVRLLSRAGGT